MYFFPDLVLVFDENAVGAIAYHDLRCEAGSTQFVEDGPIPSDAQRVGQTWQYVNKDGQPDQRFKSNRQLPLIACGALTLTSDSGLI